MSVQFTAIGGLLSGKFGADMKMLALVALLVVGFGTVGCKPRIKSLESNDAVMTPNPKASGQTIDPYTFGGTAKASGGTKPAATYATISH
jgi:hypothetical protein